MYSHFVEGDFQAMLADCDDAVTFQVAGKSPLAGKFTKANFESAFGSKLKELSNGTFSFEVHDVMASDLHGTVLATCKIMGKEKMLELRTVHVWRFQNGKPVAGYEYTRDLYQFDAAWTQ